MLVSCVCTSSFWVCWTNFSSSAISLIYLTQPITRRLETGIMKKIRDVALTFIDQVKEKVKVLYQGIWPFLGGNYSFGRYYPGAKTIQSETKLLQLTTLHWMNLYPMKYFYMHLFYTKGMTGWDTFKSQKEFMTLWSSNHIQWPCTLSSLDSIWIAHNYATSGTVHLQDRWIFCGPDVANNYVKRVELWLSWSLNEVNQGQIENLCE